MQSVRCRECGLVSWIDSETISCKRCGGPMWQKNDYGAGFSFNETNATSFFSGVIKFLTIVLGVAVLAFLLFTGLHLVGVGTGKLIAIPIIFVGFAFAIAMNLWLLARIFGESVGWGLATIFLPFAGLVALIKFWDKTQRPFIAHLISVAIIFVGILTAGMS